jgi:hypothetical protein
LNERLVQSYRQDARLDGAVIFGMNAIILHGIGVALRAGQSVSADFDFEQLLQSRNSSPAFLNHYDNC